jgi:hypothetical protein
MVMSSSQESAKSYWYLKVMATGATVASLARRSSFGGGSHPSRRRFHSDSGDLDSWGWWSCQPSPLDQVVKPGEARGAGHDESRSYLPVA